MTYALRGCPHCQGDVYMDYKQNPAMGKCLQCSRVVWEHQIPVGVSFSGAPVKGKKKNDK